MSESSRRPKVYKTHDPVLRNAVAQTGNIQLAIKKGVPRTTAIYWSKKSKINNLGSSESQVLNEEIKSLNQLLDIERLKLEFISSLAEYIPLIKSSKKSISNIVKRRILKTIKKYREFILLGKLLSLIGLGASIFHKWQAAIKKCDRSKIFECAKRKANQLTGDEVIKILNLGASKKYAHFSTTALWKYSVAHNIVVCSSDTWFKYLKSYSVDRRQVELKKKKYPVGVRASKPNEIWHIDITELKGDDDQKYYLQVIIDNFSRYIINWSLSSSKEAINTVKLLKLSKSKVAKDLKLYMDSGGENKNSLVDKVLFSYKISRALAKVDTRYSNSMIEAFFRVIKSNFLNHKSFEGKKSLNKLIQYYINKYNHKIPHNTFSYQTPGQVFYSEWSDSDDAEVQANKLLALENRKRANLKIEACSVCEY